MDKKREKRTIKAYVNKFDAPKKPKLFLKLYFENHSRLVSSDKAIRVKYNWDRRVKTLNISID